MSDAKQFLVGGVVLKCKDEQAREDITEIKSNLTELSDYSSTEQKIGKWIDGKDLYRLSYSTSYTTTGGAISKSLSIGTINIDKLVKTDISFSNTTNNVTNTQMNFYTSSTNYILGFIRNNSNTITLEVRGNLGSDTVNTTANVILYYTKN